jgi:transposase-like protein
VPDYCSPEQRQRILALLRQQERSQAWLARQLGMNESQLHHTLRGKRRLPVGFFDRVASVLGMRVEELLVERTAA